MMLSFLLMTLCLEAILGTSRGLEDEDTRDESVVSGHDLVGEGLKPESPSSGDKNR